MPSFSPNYTQDDLNKWEEVKELLRNNFDPVRYRTWFEPMKLFAVTATEVQVIIPEFGTMDNQITRYETTIESAVHRVFGMLYSLRLLRKADIERQQQLTRTTMLNPKYTFDNFVTGSSNNFAFAASLAVAEQPSEIYNPLFIYGDVGLGKTHLMNAIGNYIITENPVARIMLTTSERFANELIVAISKRNTSPLRDKMRTVDVLMVDDIQFLGKTVACQEEFFHTFNELYNAGKQIVLSSDRPPSELPTIEERLRSRFGSGLIVDIKKPDFETRVAILKRKSSEEDIDLPYDVMEYIAAHFDKSIRELEGALTRVVAQSRILGYPITLDLAVNALGQLTQTQDTRVITPQLIMDTVAEDFGIESKEMLSKKRSRDVAVPRQIAIYICRELTDLSYPAIGKAFGGRDHTTVMHSCDKVNEMMQNDLTFKHRVEDLMDKVKTR